MELSQASSPEFRDPVRRYVGPDPASMMGSFFLLIAMVYSLAWLVSMAIAGGDLLLALAGIPYLQGMTLILAVCVVYTLFGGLYWQRVNRTPVLSGIVLGSVLGVTAYFTLGWFTACLVGAAVSMLCTILARFVAPYPFPTPSAPRPSCSPSPSSRSL